ncbi:MAG TPA: VWA domain-containing protein [Chloroflexia bacterium]|nr:VWA domain-containing protein [Chloroflexia bacterium]
MGILLPVALALLALAVPIVIFYMLRLRREDLHVPSSLLWQRALQDRTANAPWQRLRRNLLLLLQLLLLLLLVLSLARPFVYTEGVATGNVVVVLDASASMRATDEEGGASRFDRAKREAGTLIDGLSGERKMAIVWAGPQALIASPATSNKGQLRAALDALSASNGRADMVTALTLASASALQMGDSTVALISDGSLPTGDGELPRVTGRALYINVGESARNVAITALSLRDTQAGPELFASVANPGLEAVDAILSIKVDGTLRDSRQVQIAANDEEVVTLQEMPLDTQLVEASLAVGDEEADMLSTDNQGWALRPRPPASDVLLVSAGNGFLEKSLNLLPNMKLFKVAPSQYVPSASYGLTVLDAYIPAQLPPGNLLILSPPDSPLVPVSGTIQYPAIGQVEVNDPLMRFVDLSGTHIAAAQRIVTPPWARVLVRATTGEPLILAGETGGRRVAVMAFDLHQSDLPLQVAFPILTANLVEWLRPSVSVGAQQSLGAGDPVSISPLPEAQEIIVTAPGGKATVLRPSGSDSMSFAGTDELGVYTVQQRADGKALGEAERFAVNLFSRDESDIAPRPDLAFAGTEAAPAQSEATRPLEIWPWVLLASLGLLSVEWWFYNRAGRLRLPARKVGS